MRVLLDECVPKRVRRELPGHAVKTVEEMGWPGVKNGELLWRGAANFDCLLTVDRTLQCAPARCQSRQYFSGRASTSTGLSVPASFRRSSSRSICFTMVLSLK